MPEPVRWLFTFSSPYHFFWFVVSMTWLAVTLVLAGRRWPAIYGSIGHAVTVIDTAIALVYLGPSPVYSVHCLWFNGLLALAHWFIFESRSLGDDHD